MHPKVQAFYAQNKDLDYISTVQDKLEGQFNEQVTGEKTTKVTRIYRIKVGGFKSSEHVWYEQKETGKDNAGNEMTFMRTVGKYEMPKAQWRFNGANSKELVGISDVQTEYDLAWNPKLIEELEEKDMISDTTQCYIQTVSRTYGPFYLEAFRSSEFEDLAFLGQNGSFPTPEQKQVLTGKKAAAANKS